MINKICKINQINKVSNMSKKYNKLLMKRCYYKINLKYFKRNISKFKKIKANYYILMK